MKKIALFCFVSFIAQAVFAQVVSLPNPKEEKIVASYLLAIGRLPAEAELNYWSGQPEYSLKDYMEQRRTYITRDNKAELEGAIKSSYASIFGRTPQPSELNYWKGQKYIFSELLGFQTDFLKSNAAEWESVIRQSYMFVFGKGPEPQELTYWKGQQPIPYTELVRKHMEFKKSQGGGYKVQSAADFSKITLNPNMNNLTFATVPFSFVLRQEIPKQLPSSYVNAVISTGGGNVISTGGGNVISTGGGNVISTGGGNVISTGGGNVITFGNGNVISTGGGNLIRR